jgi:putative transposase
MRFSLEIGLVLRHGKRTLEFTRELPDGEIQLEDMLTRRATIIKAERLIRQIMAGEYEVVLAKQDDAANGPSNAKTTIVSLASLPEQHRKMVEYRYTYVRALRKSSTTRGRRLEVERSIKATALRTNDKAPPSASTVMRWARRYESSNNNISALVDRRLFRASIKQIHPLIETALQVELKKSYFTRDRHSLVHAHEQLRTRIGRLIRERKVDPEHSVSYPTLSRRVREVDLYQRVASREGTARARYVCRTSFPDGHPSYPMERVEIDHTPLNWVVICDRTQLPLGRPVLSIMLDAYSGYVLGFYLSFYGPGLTSVAGVVRHAVMLKEEQISGLGLSNRWLSYGMGDEWVIDNGLEFHSFGFKQMAMVLGVDLMYCRVRTPWLKPRVERFFGSLNTLTLVKGRVSKPMANAVRLDPYKDAAISFSDLVTGLIQFFVDVHPFQVNQRKLATPYDLFSEGIGRCPPASYPGSWNELRLVAAPSKVLTLAQGGIELLGLPYGSFEFAPLVKRHGSRLKVLCKWDPDDMGLLHVQDPETKQWLSAQCRWKDYAFGLSLNQHQLIRKFAREQLKRDGRIEALLAAKLRLHEHWMGATGSRKRAGAVLAARFANCTSANVLGTDWQAGGVSAQADPERERSPLHLPPAQLMATQDFIVSDGEIPDFDSYSLGR